MALHLVDYLTLVYLGVPLSTDFAVLCSNRHHDWIAKGCMVLGSVNGCPCRDCAAIS